jgi:hypothetical protein
MWELFGFMAFVFVLWVATIVSLERYFGDH